MKKSFAFSLRIIICLLLISCSTGKKEKSTPLYSIDIDPHEVLGYLQHPDKKSDEFKADS